MQNGTEDFCDLIAAGKKEASHPCVVKESTLKKIDMSIF